MSVVDDVGSGSYKFLLGFSDLTTMLGSFSGSDPIVGNQGQPYLFNADLLVTMKGTQQIAIVTNDWGSFSGPPILGSQRFRRLRVDIWVDPLRNAAGNISNSDASTKNRGNQVFNVLNRHLHFRDADTRQWGDLVVAGCQLSVEPDFNRVPDGDWMMMGTAVYQVLLAGYTDQLS